MIIAGQTRDRLEAVAARHPGMMVEVVDMGDAAQIHSLAERVKTRWPGLDTVINNAGMQTLVDFRKAVDPGLIAREAVARVPDGNPVPSDHAARAAVRDVTSHIRPGR